MAAALREDSLEQMGILAFLILPGNWLPTLPAFSTVVIANSLFVCEFA